MEKAVPCLTQHTDVTLRPLVLHRTQRKGLIETLTGGWSGVRHYSTLYIHRFQLPLIAHRHRAAASRTLLPSFLPSSRRRSVEISSPEGNMLDEDHFESKADAGASKTYPQQTGTIRKNGYIVIKGRSCKVSLLTDNGSTKDNQRLPTDDTLLTQIKDGFAEEKDLVVTVMSAMGDQELNSHAMH